MSEWVSECRWWWGIYLVKEGGVEAKLIGEEVGQGVQLLLMAVQVISEVRPETTHQLIHCLHTLKPFCTAPLHCVLLRVWNFVPRVSESLCK